MNASNLLAAKSLRSVLASAPRLAPGLLISPGMAPLARLAAVLGAALGVQAQHHIDFGKCSCDTFCDVRPRSSTCCNPPQLPRQSP